jgi:hypothetical protein
MTKKHSLSEFIEFPPIFLEFSQDSISHTTKLISGSIIEQRYSRGRS